MNLSIDRLLYVRLGSSNRQADSQLIAELQRCIAGISFDTLPMVDLDVEALDLSAIESDFQSRNIDGSMLQSLKIFTVYFNEPVAPLPEQSRKSLPESSKEKRSGLWAQSGAQSGAQSEVVLKILINTSLSAAELVDALGLETKTGAFKRTIKDLLEKELIAYTIPEKPNSRLQKYRITDQGKILIQEKGAGNE